MEVISLSNSKDKRDATFAALPVYVRFNGKEKLVVALVDSGSDTTLVAKTIVDELGITGDQAAPVAVHTMNGPALQQGELLCKLELLSDDKRSSVVVDEALTVPAIPVRAVVDGKAFNEWPHLRDLELPYIPRAKIGIIIGTDCPEMHRSLEERHAGRKDPIARKTPLGWIVLGPSEKADSVQSLATTVGSRPRIKMKSDARDETPLTSSYLMRTTVWESRLDHDDHWICRQEEQLVNRDGQHPIRRRCADCGGRSPPRRTTPQQDESPTSDESGLS